MQYDGDSARVVVARGSYDLHSIAPLADALSVASRERRKVVLDASGVSFADSTFLNLLLRTHHATALCVVAPPLQLMRLFEITGTDAVLEIRTTWAEATGVPGPCAQEPVDGAARCPAAELTAPVPD